MNPTNLIFCMNDFLVIHRGSCGQNLKISFESSGGQPVCMDGFNGIIVDFLFELVMSLDSTHPQPLKSSK